MTFTNTYTDHDYRSDERISADHLTPAIELALIRPDCVDVDDLEEWFDNIRECVNDVIQLAERTMTCTTNKSIIHICERICENPMDVNHVRALMLYYDDRKNTPTD